MIRVLAKLAAQESHQLAVGVEQVGLFREEARHQDSFGAVQLQSRRNGQPHGDPQRLALLFLLAGLTFCVWGIRGQVEGVAVAQLAQAPPVVAGEEARVDQGAVRHVGQRPDPAALVGELGRPEQAGRDVVDQQRADQVGHFRVVIPVGGQRQPLQHHRVGAAAVVDPGDQLGADRLVRVRDPVVDHDERRAARMPGQETVEVLTTWETSNWDGGR